MNRGALYKQKQNEALLEVLNRFDDLKIDKNILYHAVLIAFEFGWQAHKEGLTKAVESLNIGEEKDDDGNDGNGRE